MPNQAAQSPLRGAVDQPVRGARLSTSGFIVRGWSAWGDQPAVAVAVMLDGIVVGRAATGSDARPDVAAALGVSGLAGAGWRVELAPEHPEARLAELSVVVWGEPGAQPVVLDRFTITLEASDELTGESIRSEFQGSLEEPSDASRVKSAFAVRGWAMHEGTPISRLDVLVNGFWVGRARMGVARPDVAQVVAGASTQALISGFEHWVDLSSVPAASVLKVQVLARIGEAAPVSVFERVVRVAPEDGDAVPPASAQGGRRGDTRRADGAMKLVVFTHRLDYGGGQLWLEEFLAKSGAGSRYDCTVIAFRGGALRDAMERRGIEVHVTSAPAADDYEQYEGRIAELTSLLARGGYDVALVNTAPMFSGADVARRLGIPTVWAIHESLTPDVLLAVAFGGDLHPAVRKIARRTMASANALVFEAETTREMYAPWAGTDRTIVVPYGVDTAVIESYCSNVSQAEARADVGLAPDARVVLVMGTIEPRKAQTRIAQAFAQVADDYPDWTLVFVGDMPSQYSDALHTYLKSTGLDERCRVVPVDEDAYRWYRAADLLLSASDMESLPRSMLETMCFGTPVLSTAVFGVSELLQDGTTGFLFEANDLEALIGALRRVMGMKSEQLVAVGNTGRRHVLEQYDSAGYAADLMKLFEGLLRDTSATPGEILAPGARRSGAGRSR